MIFLSLVDRPQDEWPAALAGLRRQAGRVRKVERLLADHVLLGTISQAEDFDRTSPATRDAEGPGTVIAAITSCWSRSAKGASASSSWPSRRQPVRRKVALKVIKPGMDTRQVIARFEAERQALAMMDHPNIAKVFDGGATDVGPAVLRDGTGQGRADHRVLRPAPA